MEELANNYIMLILLYCILFITPLIIINGSNQIKFKGTNKQVELKRYGISCVASLLLICISPYIGGMTSKALVTGGYLTILINTILNLKVLVYNENKNLKLLIIFFVALVIISLLIDLNMCGNFINSNDDNDGTDISDVNLFDNNNLVIITRPDVNNDSHERMLLDNLRISTTKTIDTSDIIGRLPSSEPEFTLGDSTFGASTFGDLTTGESTMGPQPDLKTMANSTNPKVLSLLDQYKSFAPQEQMQVDQPRNGSSLSNGTSLPNIAELSKLYSQR